jgi:hypothetical protein
MKASRSTVLHVLARHLERPLSSLHPWQELERDLDVTPLEIALLTLEVERIEGVDLDSASLDSARTVGELVRLLTREVDRARFTAAKLDVA